jgi:Uma2 family endonuclease
VLVCGEISKEFFMGTPQPIASFSFSDYLIWEESQSEKHEFVRSEVFAMTDARREHVTVAGNLFAAFRSHLRGSPCRSYIADMKVRLAIADAAFYPAVMVTCDQRDHAADLFMSHPKLIVEVLSDSTAAYDRGDKFADYRKLESLQEFVIVDIAARRVECFRRDASNHWVLFDYSGDGECRFDSIDLDMPLADVFEDVEPPLAEVGQ